MGSVRAWGAAAGIAVMLGGCAHDDAHPKLVWQHEDGTPATRAELSAAKDACIASTPPDASSPHPRGERHQYAAQVVACIESKGFRLAEEPTP